MDWSSSLTASENDSGAFLLQKEVKQHANETKAALSVSGLPKPRGA